MIFPKVDVVVKCDVLIIGGGLGGTWAGMRRKSRGRERWSWPTRLMSAEAARALFEPQGSCPRLRACPLNVGRGKVWSWAELGRLPFIHRLGPDLNIGVA